MPNQNDTIAGKKEREPAFLWGPEGEAFEQEVALLYDPGLPYHNFGHALDTVVIGKRLVAECLSEEISIDPTIVSLACLLHDAGFHLDHTRKGFPSKEAYSAHLAEGILTRWGVPQDTIAHVQQAILATQEQADVATPEDCTVRAADLFNLGGPYEVFLQNARRLKQEYERMRGETIAWTTWQQMVNGKLNIFLSQEIPLTTFFQGPPGQSPFHLRIKQNLTRFNQERR